VPSELDQVMATGNMQKNLVKFNHVVFELRRGADKQNTHHNILHHGAK